MSFHALMHRLTNGRASRGTLLPSVLNLTERVKALLRITKLNTLFNITADEATSLKSFSPIICPSLLLTYYEDSDRGSSA